MLTSCGHRGIVNSVRAAIQVSGINKVHAILGGFHLMPMPMPIDYIKATIAELKSIDPVFLIPMHCSDLPFYEEAKAQMPGKVPLASTGTTFVFG
jgi:7,8-dihydropterin-6-yl-methyl-4-(beta-D-ribofuranosyl)aminobenzene 5'-phosphate synthase